MLHMMLKDMFHGSLHDTFKIYVNILKISINCQCLKMFIKCTSYNTIMLLKNIPLDEYLKMVNHLNILAHSKVLLAHQLIFLITKPNEHLVVFSTCVLHVFNVSVIPCWDFVVGFILRVLTSEGFGWCLKVTLQARGILNSSETLHMTSEGLGEVF